MSAACSLKHLLQMSSPYFLITPLVVEHTLHLLLGAPLPFLGCAFQVACTMSVAVMRECNDTTPCATATIKTHPYILKLPGKQRGVRGLQTQHTRRTQQVLGKLIIAATLHQKCILALQLRNQLLDVVQGIPGK
jgi:hypothetical protein